MKFIDFIAERIKENNWLNDDLVVVLPSSRAVKYLMAALSKSYGKPIFAPKILTIDALFSSLAPKKIIDPSRYLLLLYKAYCIVETETKQDFESFLTWAPLVLNDFEDINRYLLDPKDVFKNLKAIKELESWNLEDKEITEAQKVFMRFWDLLPGLYAALDNLLLQQNYITPAQSYRHLAQNTELLFSENSNSFYVFAGFNALSAAETKVIDYLIKKKAAVYFIDSDVYYLSNPTHEAGLFQRKNNKAFGINKPEFVRSELSTKPLKIDLIQCAQLTGQVKIAATELAKISPAAMEDTLVLLADETLISALVKNLPLSIGKANITLGLPLNQTPIKSWIEIIFDIQENKSRFKTNAVYHKDLQRIINHIFCISWLDDAAKAKLVHMEQDMIRYNRVFQNLDNLKISADVLELLNKIYIPWDQDWSKAMDCIRAINSFLGKQIPSSFEFENSILSAFDQSINAFEIIVNEGLPDLSLRTFKLLFSQHWHSKSIAFHGNPIDGLQIMGLLETRLLDFKRIILLGMNEGNLPPTNNLKTIIPIDLRKGLGLPTQREKQGIFAQHFYRLLHYCEDLTITYTTLSDQITNAEPSRYLNQLELELARINPNIEFKKSYYVTSFPEKSDIGSSIIEKKSDITTQLDAYFEKPISASALNKYLTCPLDFYYRYIVEFGEADTVMEEIESSAFGTFIHDTLEQLFLPFAQRDKERNFISPAPPPLSTSSIDRMLIAFPPILYARFMKHFNNDKSLFATGKNLLSFEMANEIVSKTLFSEKEFISSLTEPLFVEQLEAPLACSVVIQLNGSPKTIQLKGFIDRIDRIGDNYRILDYKSGQVKPEHVLFKWPEGKTLREAFKGSKHTLQLSLYCLLFEKNYNCKPDEASILSLVTSTGYTQKLRKEGGSISEMPALFEQLLEETINEIYDLSVPFEHDDDAKYCNYC